MSKTHKINTGKLNESKRDSLPNSAPNSQLEEEAPPEASLISKQEDKINILASAISNQSVKVAE